MRNTGNMVHGGERVGLKIAGEFRPTDFPPNMGSLTKPSQAALPCPYLGIPWCPRPQAPRHHRHCVGAEHQVHPARTHQPY